MAWNSRCWTRAIVGQLPAALSDCKEALRLRPGYVNALDSRGLVYLKLGQPDFAIADYSLALRVDPNKASSLYGRGIAKHRKGDAAGANADFAAARAIKASVSADFTRYGVEGVAEPVAQRD